MKWVEIQQILHVCASNVIGWTPGTVSERRGTDLEVIYDLSVGGGDFPR